MIWGKGNKIMGVREIKLKQHLKSVAMTLSTHTKYGLTFGQILSVLTLFGGIITVWVSLNVRIAQAEIKIQQLEQGRIENANNILRIHNENREDHREMIKKLDDVIIRLNDNNNKKIQP